MISFINMLGLHVVGAFMSVDVGLEVVKALISGGMLFIGIYLGSKMSARTIKKELLATADESETVQKLKKMLNDPEFEGNLSKLLNNAAGFFEEAKVLVSSPEAKNFFKNASALVEQFSSESPKLLEMPKKP